jgi:glycosyltransferase involved in cell wall biosynthesis
MTGPLKKVPRVSIVVPAFNEPVAVLTESLDSLLAQTYSDFECLVIDESTNTVSAAACRALCARDPRFIYVRPETRIGLAASLNLGIAMARAELIARFDSDDICMPRRLELQVAFLDAHREIDVLGGGLEIFSEDRKEVTFRTYPSDSRAIEQTFQTTTAIAHPTVMLRKRVLTKHGGYAAEFRFAEDLDLWLRLLNRGVRFANMSEILVRYRQQHTQRNRHHWRFNLKARTRNFSARFFARRIFGICAVAVWGRLPVPVQNKVFESLLLSRGQ